jgi:DNA-binding LacI/PurR family transcriptional regulator
MQSKSRDISSLQDLADAAGVSRATASRALNNSPLINVKTREKLQALAAKHNYTVNRQARDFRLRQTRVVSVVFMLDANSDQHPSDPFFLEMLGSIADSLAAHDYDLLLAHAPIRNVHELARTRIGRHADGLIFVGQGEEHNALNRLAESGAKIVVWGEPVEDKQYVIVSSDNTLGGFSAADHLLERGRRRIAFFGNRRTPENRARFAGFKKALRQKAIRASEDLFYDIPSDLEQARRKITELLKKEVSMDGIVCTSDVMALAAISAITDQGLNVPRDVAVTGYDDIRLASYSSPPLTTVRQNIQLAGSVLAQSLLKQIEGEDVEDTVLKSELVVRRSS